MKTFIASNNNFDQNIKIQSLYIGRYMPMIANILL